MLGPSILPPLLDGAGDFRHDLAFPPIVVLRITDAFVSRVRFWVSTIPVKRFHQSINLALSTKGCLPCPGILIGPLYVSFSRVNLLSVLVVVSHPQGDHNFTPACE